MFVFKMARTKQNPNPKSPRASTKSPRASTKSPRASTKSPRASTKRKSLGRSRVVPFQSPKLAEGERRSPGQLARAKIEYYQEDAESYNIPKIAMERLIREILQETSVDTRLSEPVIDLIHEVSEDFLVDLFNKSNRVAVASKRKTVKPSDMELIEDLGKSGFCKFYK